MTTLATPTVEVAWTGAIAGVWTVGVSLVGGPDVPGSAFGHNVFDDITSDVKTCHIKRGAPSMLGAVVMSTCLLTLKDSAGAYNPKNPTSPLAGYLKPMRPLRVQSTHPLANGGAAKGRFSGFIRRIWSHPHPSVQESYIEAVDFLIRLDRVRPVIASTGPIRVGAAIGLVLDYAGWTAPDLRALDAGGDEIPDFAPDGTQTGRQIVEELLTTDLGAFFVDSDGVTTYHSRARRFRSEAAVDTFTAADISDAEPSTDLAQIVNRQSVTRTGGTPQSAEDTDSIHEYGDADGSPITSANLNTDAQAANLAAFLVALRKDPAEPAPTVTVWNTSDTNITRQLEREYGDRVALTESRGGTNMEGVICGVEVHIDHGGTIEQAQYLIAERGLSVWTVGVSLVGGLDIVGY